jgi:hypothetical protein
MKLMTTRPLFFTALGFLCGHVVASEHWPQFPGPNAAGISTNTSLPTQWSATENVAWKTDLPGRSWSSPIRIP